MGVQLDAIGIIAKDLEKSISFYKLLGIPAPDFVGGENHVEATLPSGIRLMWDSEEFMKEIGFWKPSTGQKMGLAFLCGSPAEVDSVFAEVVAAGYPGLKEPFDAFWGQRYAQVEDPDGNAVDLFAAL